MGLFLKGEVRSFQSLQDFQEKGGDRNWEEHQMPEN